MKRLAVLLAALVACAVFPAHAQENKTIPAGSKVFIEVGDHTANLSAAIRDEQVDLVLVMNKDDADFTIRFSTTFIISQSDITGAFVMKRVKDQVVVFEFKVSRNKLLVESVKVSRDCAKKLKKRVKANKQSGLISNPPMPGRKTSDPPLQAHVVEVRRASA